MRKIRLGIRLTVAGQRGILTRLPPMETMKFIMRERVNTFFTD